jgi:micrococcal nuclease
MYEYNCNIVKVVDGDTVDVDIDLGFGMWLKNERIRLYGIDTPESRTRDPEEKQAGLYAKKVVQDYLPKNKPATLVTIKDKGGKFGRTLGKFKIKEKDDKWFWLHETMIKNHIGVEYHGQSKYDIDEQHVVNRKILKEKGLI